MQHAGPTIVQQPQVASPSAGELPVIPDYQVLHLLGQGGMGKVYQARHLKLNRMVAIKLVTGTGNDHALARFDEEVKAIASLRHPHIAQIFENGLVDDRPFYAMEYIAGGTLSDRLKQTPLPPRQAAELLLALARAMQHAHEHHVLHRDLKPGNILLEPNTLDPKIADFGLAKRLNDDTKLTRTGEIFGSPSYMAPEQASGVMKLTTAVDVYALGAILYECLTGRPPFIGPDAMQTVMMVLTNDPLPPKQLQPKLPLDLNTICMKCLEKQPKRRYPSALALAEDLSRFLQGEPIVARPVSGLERLQKWAIRRPWQATAVVLAALLMIGLALGIFFLDQAYCQAQAANDIANKSYELSRNTLDNILSNITGELAMVPHMERVAVESYRPAIALYRDLHALRPDHLPTTLEYLKKQHEFSMQLILSHQHGEAQQVLQQTEDLLQSELKRHPDDRDLQTAQVKFLLCHAWFARGQKQADQARADQQEARQLLANLQSRYPDDVRLMLQANDLLQFNIDDRIAAGQTDAVLELYRQKLANYEKIYQFQPSQHHAQLMLGGIRSLATMQLAMKLLPEAEASYRAIEQLMPTLQLDDRVKINLVVTLKKGQSDIFRYRLKPDESLKALLEAEQANRQLLERFPEDAAYNHDAFDIRIKKAVLAYQLGQVQQGIDQLKLCVKDTESFLKTHPNYTSIAEHLKRQREALTLLQDQAQPRP